MIKYELCCTNLELVYHAAIDLIVISFQLVSSGFTFWNWDSNLHIVSGGGVSGGVAGVGSKLPCKLTIVSLDFDPA